MNTWDTFPVHDERIPPGLSLTADCSLDVGAVRSSFWQELRAGLDCWEEPLPDDVLVISSGRSRRPPTNIGVIRGIGIVSG